MKFIKIKSSISFILIFSFSCFAPIISYAQSIHQTFDFGRQLMHLNQPEKAIAAFQRVLFFGDEDFQQRVFPNIADCYFLLGDYSSAARYYDLAYFAAVTDSAKTGFTFKKIESLIREKSFLFAKVEILNLSEDLPPPLAKKKSLYEGIIYYGLGEYAASKESFLTLLPGNNHKTAVLESFSKLKKVDKINPKKARVMSMIIPGLGHFYAGDVRNGINSLVLNGGFAYLTLQTMFNYSLWDAAISILPWYQRYHMGGYNRAEEAAHEKIRNKTAEIFEEIIMTVASAQSSTRNK